MSAVQRPAAGFALPDVVKLCFIAGFSAVSLLAVGWAIGGIRQVPPDSRAVILRFGQIDRVREAGLVLAWPSPIEQVTLVPAFDREVPLPVEESANAGPVGEIDFKIHQPDDVVTLQHQKDTWNGQYFLTGDDSVVRFQATMYYRVTDPAAYVLARDHVEPALQRLFRSSAVTLAAAHDLDDFMVARPTDADHPVSQEVANRRQALRGEMVTAINARLAALHHNSGDLGVEMSRMDIVVLLPPLAKAAFDDVLTAAQTADQTIAAARTDAARTTQVAQREYDHRRAEAQAAAEEQVRVATSQTADVSTLHARMTSTDRNVLLQQYYRDRIGPIIGRIGHVTTVDPGSSRSVIIQGPEE